MFIRRAKTRSTSERRDLLRLPTRAKRAQRGQGPPARPCSTSAADFAVERRHWPLLCSRIQQLLGRQGELVPLACPQEVERQAQQIAAQLLERAPKRAAEPADLHQVDVNSLAMVRPRSVGVEAIGLWAMEQLGLGSLLERLGFGARDRTLAMAAVIARMARPGSEARHLALAVRALGPGRTPGGGLRAPERRAPQPGIKTPCWPTGTP